MIINIKYGNMKNLKGNSKKVVSFLLICLFIMNAVFTTINASTSNKSQMPLNSPPYEYYNYQEMTDLFLDLEENHSNIMSLTSIGRTYEGRDIWMVKLSDNVDLYVARAKKPTEDDFLCAPQKPGNLI